MKRIYDENAIVTAKASAAKLDPRSISLLAHIGVGKKVLDIGCSHGAISKLISDKGNYVIGVDISETYVHEARKKGVKAYVWDVEGGDVRSIPNELNDVYDVVLMMNVLEHLIDPLMVLRDRIRPLLRKGGVLIADVPNMGYIVDRFRLLFGLMPRFQEERSTAVAEPRPYHLLHKTHFTRKTLKEMLEMSGFIIREIEGSSDYEGINFPRVRSFLTKVRPTLFALDLRVIAERG